MGKKRSIVPKIPKVCREFVATNLILRAVGFKTSELSISITEKSKELVNIDLLISRSENSFTIELGEIKLPHKTVLKYWEMWVEVGTKEISKDFSDSKTLFYSLNAYKTMEMLFENLQEHGFMIKDTNIMETL